MPWLCCKNERDEGMGLRVYNTLSRRVQDFEPQESGKVKMYVCGVTVYDSSHIGHARAIVFFDVLYRYLKFLDYGVRYVRNFTDVDDKIIARANREGASCEQIAERYIGEFYEDFDALGVLRPDVEPRATEHIDDMIRLIERLVENGYAYVRDGNVYFSVRKFKGYGKLSGRSLDDMIAGARVEVAEDKDDPMDFALWKKSKEGEPKWSSPWGEGRPGWHIECSAMSMKYLGDTLDIHGGGQDLIFPHHENEIAQSEGATGKQFVRYWIHNGYLTIDQEKMSKSLGNFFTIQEILTKYSPDTLRYFLLSVHYRKPIDYTEENLSNAAKAIERIYLSWDEALSLLEKYGGEYKPPKSADEKFKEAFKELESIRGDFIEAMDDDLNTAAASGQFFKLVHVMNQITARVSSEGALVDQKALLMHALDIFEEFRAILGYPIKRPDEYLANRIDEGLHKAGLSHEEVERLIVERNEARRARDYERADEIRKYLAEKGIILEDSKEGTTWRVGS